MTLAEFVAIEGTLVAVMLVMLCFPSGRRAFAGMFRHMRWMYVEWPLRKITGRRRPDYARIAQLEREARRDAG